MLCMEENDNENNKIYKHLNLIRRRLRDIQDSFEIPDNTFRKLYRLVYKYIKYINIIII